MNAQPSRQRHIDEGLCLVNVPSSRLDEAPRDIEGMSGAEVEALCQVCSAARVDIHLSCPEDKHIIHPGVLHDSNQRAQGAPSLSRNASRARSGNQPGNACHRPRVAGRPRSWGLEGAACGKPSSHRLGCLFYTVQVGVRLAPPGSATRKPKG